MQVQIVGAEPDQDRWHVEVRKAIDLQAKHFDACKTSTQEEGGYRKDAPSGGVLSNWPCARHVLWLQHACSDTYIHLLGCHALLNQCFMP